MNYYQKRNEYLLLLLFFNINFNSYDLYIISLNKSLNSQEVASSLSTFNENHFSYFCAVICWGNRR